MTTSLPGNRYVASAMAFAADNATHVHSLRRTSRLVRGRERSAAVHLFTPRETSRPRAAVALIPGGALTPEANFYALGPNLMAANPRRVFAFPDTPGTGHSGRDVRDLSHREYAVLYLHALRAVVGETPCVLGGHSQGGGYAQTVARINDERAVGGPDNPRNGRLNLAGLLLLDPVPLEGARYILWRFARRPTATGVVRHIVCTPAASDEMVAYFRWALGADKALSPRATWANIGGRDFPDANHPFTGPVLILGAEDSGTIKQDRLWRMQASAAYPRGVYQAIGSAPDEPAGHLDYLAYRRTTQAITAFLDDCFEAAPGRDP